MRTLKLAVLTGLTLAAAPAAAQTPFKFLSGGTVTAYGYYVGPYSGAHGPGYTNPVVLNCVDFFHSISVGQTWTANITNLSSSNLSNTRFASQFANAATLYRQAAYLTTQYAGKTSAQIAQIQATIWRLFDPNLTVDPTPPNSNTNLWLSMAQANYHTIDARQFYIVTDVNKLKYDPTTRTYIDNPQSAQEFIVYNATPEPATMVLLGSGLAGLAAARRRKKKATSDAEGQA